MRVLLAIVILLFIVQSSKGGCDEKKCKVGMSVGAGVCAVTGGILSAVAGLATAGAGWGVGAAITGGVCTGLTKAMGACAACSSNNPPDLANVMQDLQENFEIINIQLDEINLATKQLKAGIEMSHILVLFSEDIGNLENVGESFQSIQKDKRGTLISDWRAVNFVEAAMDSHNGVVASVHKIHKMLVGGNILKPQSIWKALPDMCNHDTRDYFLRLISQAYIHLSIALSMKGLELNKNEIENMKRMIIKSQHVFNNDCGCQNDEVLSKRPDLQFLLQSYQKSDDMKFIKYLTSKSKDWQIIRKLSLLYSARRFELTDKIIATIPLKRPIEDFHLLSKLNEGENLEDIRLFKDQNVCYAKVEGGPSELIPLSVHMSTTVDRNWVGMNCIDNDINTGCRSANHDKNPWLGLDFGEEVFVSHVTLNMRLSRVNELKNAKVLVGGGSTPRGQTLGQFQYWPAKDKIIKIKTSNPEGLRGRFLYIQMTNSLLNPMEITAHGRRLLPPSGIEGSKFVPFLPVSAHVSSTYVVGRFPTSNCHDGKNDNYCHTGKERYPWLVLDLGKLRKVRTITIFNRVDACADRLKDVDVRISDHTPTTSSVPFRAGIKLGFFEGTKNLGDAITLVSERPLAGRYVVITQNSKGRYKEDYMNIAEVTVMGDSR